MSPSSTLRPDSRGDFFRSLGKLADGTQPKARLGKNKDEACLRNARLQVLWNTWTVLAKSDWVANWPQWAAAWQYPPWQEDFRETWPEPVLRLAKGIAAGQLVLGKTPSKDIRSAFELLAALSSGCRVLDSAEATAEAERLSEAQALRRKSASDRHQAFEKMGEENKHFIKHTLKPEQCKRLFQISIQVAGLLFVTDPRLESELKLTEAQKKKTHELQEQAHKEVLQFFRAKNTANIKEEMKRLHQASRKRLMGLLTADQKAKWKELAGKPFKGELHFERAKSSK